MKQELVDRVNVALEQGLGHDAMAAWWNTELEQLGGRSPAEVVMDARSFEQDDVTTMMRIAGVSLEQA